MKKFIFLLTLVIGLASCSTNYTAEEKEYIAGVENFRTEKNRKMQNDSHSPFNAKGKVHFENLKYFDVDPAYVFQSKLYEFDNKDTVTIYGTKGEARKAIRFGYVIFRRDNKDHHINVCKCFTKTGQEYYSISFTDRTTGKETYDVGRYLDFEKNDDQEHLYTIDFNREDQ